MLGFLYCAPTADARESNASRDGWIGIYLRVVGRWNLAFAAALLAGRAGRYKQEKKTLTSVLPTHAIHPKVYVIYSRPMEARARTCTAAVRMHASRQ
jgi:hypothetical protein